VQPEARCSDVGHGGGESAPIAEQPGRGQDRRLLAADPVAILGLGLLKTLPVSLVYIDRKKP
jgi:hypothetical protein